MEGRGSWHSEQNLAGFFSSLGSAFPGRATRFPCFRSSGSGQLSVATHCGTQPPSNKPSPAPCFPEAEVTATGPGSAVQSYLGVAAGCFSSCAMLIGREAGGTSPRPWQSEMPASLRSREPWPSLVSHTQHSRRVFGCCFESICSPRCRWEEREELALLKHLRSS